MLTIGLICTFVAAASAGYASSSGYAGSGAYSSPVGPYASPIDFQNQFAQYYNSISQFNQKHLTTSYAGDGAAVAAYASLSPPRQKHYENEYLKNLFQQQLAHQAAIFQQNQAIQNQIQSNIAAASGGGGYGGSYGGGYGYQPSSIPNRFGGAGTSSFASGGAFAGGNGGGVGSYGGVRPGGQVYGGTSGGRPQYSPNYGSAGGSVSSNGHQQQHAAIYPANPSRPNLDSRFGDEGVGITHTSNGNQPGFVGVSSFSSSSDINGHKNRESGTSVNNNGHVTHYHTRN